MLIHLSSRSLRILIYLRKISPDQKDWYDEAILWRKDEVEEAGESFLANEGANDVAELKA